MRSTLQTLTTAVLVAALGTWLSAQKTTQTGVGSGGTAHFKSEWTIDGAHLTIDYGRPTLKGRPETQMMPAGQPWRTGADQATIITSDKPLTFGTIKLEPGSYTINTQPGDRWQLILGKLTSPSQWGIPYKPELEIGRTPMTLGKTGAPVEQLTISIDDTAAGATLRIEWGTTKVTVPFKIG